MARGNAGRTEVQAEGAGGQAARACVVPVQAGATASGDASPLRPSSRAKVAEAEPH